MVNFEKLGEIAYLFSVGETIAFDNSILVNMFNYDEFVRNNFDA